LNLKSTSLKCPRFCGSPFCLGTNAGLILLNLLWSFIIILIAVPQFHTASLPYIVYGS